MTDCEYFIVIYVVCIKMLSLHAFCLQRNTFSKKQQCFLYTH